MIETAGSIATRAASGGLDSNEPMGTPAPGRTASTGSGRGASRRDSGQHDADDASDAAVGLGAKGGAQPDSSQAARPAGATIIFEAQGVAISVQQQVRFRHLPVSCIWGPCRAAQKILMIRSVEAAKTLYSTYHLRCNAGSIYFVALIRMPSRVSHLPTAHPGCIVAGGCSCADLCPAIGAPSSARPTGMPCRGRR